MLELVALTSDAEAGRQLADDLGGTSYRNHDGEHDRRPYSGMVRVATDRIEPLRAVADVGLFTAFARLVKAPEGAPSPDRVVCSFGLVANPDLGHGAADDHWRDRHGPLALRSHSAMCDYTQLSIVAVHHGLALDGIALCAFDSRQDARERFYDDDDARAAIEADVAQFADLRNSPRRVVLVENDPGSAA
ncbi:MAG: EthD family reductase [Actinomycetota bacterium]